MIKVVLALSIAAILGVMPRSARADDWNTTDCAQAKLTVSGYPDEVCKRGPDNGKIACVVEQFMVTSDRGNFTVHLFILPARNCFLERPSDTDAEIRQFFSGLSSASGWSENRDVAGATGAYLDGGNEKCFSFYKPGPSRIGSEGGGVVWALHGLLCSGAKTLDDQAVEDFIASVKVDQ